MTQEVIGLLTIFLGPPVMGCLVAWRAQKKWIGITASGLLAVLAIALVAIGTLGNAWIGGPFVKAAAYTLAASYGVGALVAWLLWKRK